MKKLMIVGIFCVLSACGSKTLDAPEFDYTMDELVEVKREYRKTKYDILFLLMVDEHGKVLRSKILDFDDDKLDRVIVQRIKKSTMKLEFEKAKPGDKKFRQIPYPVRINSEYDWR